MHLTDKYSQHSSIIGPVWLNVWVLFYELSGFEFEWDPVAVTWTSDIVHVLNKEFFDIEVTIECRFILKRVRGMKIAYIQMHYSDKYSQRSSIIWPVWLNSWVLVYEPSGNEFEFRCCQYFLSLGASFLLQVSDISAIKRFCILQISQIHWSFLQLFWAFVVTVEFTLIYLDSILCFAIFITFLDFFLVSLKLSARRKFCNES